MDAQRFRALPATFGLYFFWQFAGLIVIFVFLLPLAGDGGGIAGVVLMLILTVAGSTRILSRLFEESVFGRPFAYALYLGVLTLAGNVGVGPSASYLSDLIWRESVGPISAADAPACFRAGRFLFTDARVEADLSSYLRQSSGRKTSGRTLRIAPIVPFGWTKALPVPAWAVCSEACGWKADWRAAIRAHPNDRELHLHLKRNAEQRYGLKSAPDAPLLVWTKDPDAAFRNEAASAGIVLLILAALWLIGVLIAYRARFSRNDNT